MILYDSQTNGSGISETITRVRSTSVIISDIPLMSLLTVLSTDLTTYHRLIVGFILQRSTVIQLSNLLLLPSTYPSAYFVTVIQPDIGLESLFKNTYKMSRDWFYEGANILYGFNQSDIDLKVHFSILQNTDCEVILFTKEQVEPREWYIGNTVLITTGGW